MSLHCKRSKRLALLSSKFRYGDVVRITQESDVTTRIRQMSPTDSSCLLPRTSIRRYRPWLDIAEPEWRVSCADKDHAGYWEQPIRAYAQLNLTTSQPRLFGHASYMSCFDSDRRHHVGGDKESYIKWRRWRRTRGQACSCWAL